MHQISTSIWNDIAAHQPLSAEWRPLFECTTAEELRQAWDAYWRKIPRPFDNRVQRAFEVVGPLLFENVAISDYIVENNRFDLRPALPEVLTPEEAVELASLEFQLNAGRLAQLHSLLSALTDLQSALGHLQLLLKAEPSPPVDEQPPRPDARPRLPRRKVRPNVHQQLTRQIATDCGRRVTARVMKQLRNLRAHLSGDDSGLANAWEEFCVQVQGEESYFWDAYVVTVKDVIRGALTTVRPLEVTAMWLQTRQGYDWLAANEGLGGDPPAAMDPDVVEWVYCLVLELAASKQTRVVRFLARAAVHD